MKEHTGAVQQIDKMKNSKASQKKSLKKVFIKSAKGLIKNLPIMLGVIFTIGLVKAFISFDTIAKLFTGIPLADTFIGTFIGSIMAGNSINSYIIGDEMLKSSISMFAVASFLVAWVTVGFIQLPYEAKMLGKKFTIIRNIISIILSIFTGLVTVIILQGVM